MDKVIVSVIIPHRDDEFYSCMSVFPLANFLGADLHLYYFTKGESQNKRWRAYRQIKEYLTIEYPKLNIVAHTLDLFPDGHPERIDMRDLVGAIDKITISSNWLFMPSRSHHQDHEKINKACMASIRSRTTISGLLCVCEYEYMYNKEDNVGNLYLPLTDSEMALKIEFLKLIDKEDPILNHQSVNSIEYISQTHRMDGFRYNSVETKYAERFNIIYQKLKF